jgi:hypothetical protein
MNITFEFAKQDDCLDKMVPSDLRKLVSERDYFKNGMAELQDIIDKMQPERDVLAAQVQVLRIAALNAIQAMSGGDAKADLRDAYDATPAACLAQVKADAVQEFVMFLPPYSYSINDLLSAEAKKYAERIRQGVV